MTEQFKVGDLVEVKDMNVGHEKFPRTRHYFMEPRTMISWRLNHTTIKHTLPSIGSRVYVRHYWEQTTVIPPRGGGKTWVPKVSLIPGTKDHFGPGDRGVIAHVGNGFLYVYMPQGRGWISKFHLTVVQQGGEDE